MPISHALFFTSDLQNRHAGSDISAYKKKFTSSSKLMIVKMRRLRIAAENAIDDRTLT